MGGGEGFGRRDRGTRAAQAGAFGRQRALWVEAEEPQVKDELLKQVTHEVLGSTAVASPW